MLVRNPAELRGLPCTEDPIDCFPHLRHPSSEHALPLFDTTWRQARSFFPLLHPLHICAPVQPERQGGLLQRTSDTTSALLENRLFRTSLLRRPSPSKIGPLRRLALLHVASTVRPQRD